MTELPSEPELFAGRMEDGSCPPLRSHELYYHWDKTIPGGRQELAPLEVDAQRLHYRINLNHLRQLDKALAFGEALVDAGLHALKTAPVAQAPSPAQAVGAPPTAADTSKRPDPLLKQRKENQIPAEPAGRPVDACSDVLVPPVPFDDDAREVGKILDAMDKLKLEAELAAPGSDPLFGTKRGSDPFFNDSAKHQKGTKRGSDPFFNDGANPKQGVRPSFQKAKRGSDPGPAAGAGDPESRTRLSGTFADANPALHKLPLEKLLPLAEKGARLIVSASAKRAELAHKLVEQAFGLDVRKSFLQDRAVAVVYATLLHLDEQFRDVGFGSWMPFRFPDQWLAFCGIMRRVLAANGLIHSRHADTYRKLLDETPPVEIEGEIDDRIKQARTPINPARCWENRGAETMADLAERIWHEVDHPPYPPPRKQYAPD